MPRGGRRPHAGAPRGNFNAVRSGNHSMRMAMVYLRLAAEPDQLALARDLYEAGFFPPPDHRFRRSEVPRVVDFLWRRWFDSSGAQQSKTIEDDPEIAAAAGPGRAAQIPGAARPTGIAPGSENREKNK